MVVRMFLTIVTLGKNIRRKELDLSDVVRLEDD